MNRYVLFFTLALMIAPALAQDWAPSGPPKVLSITTEVLKPGTSATHEKIESGWRRAFTKADWPYHWLAASSISGVDRMLFLTGYQSFADAQTDDDRQDALDWLRIEQEKLAIEDSVYVASKTHQMAVYVPELSLHSTVPLGSMRHLLITTVEVEPAREQEFRKQMQTQVTSRPHENNMSHYATYRILLGAAEATFAILQPLQTMKALDQTLEASMKNMPAAGVKSIRRDLMAFSPSMSYVSKEFAVGNTPFWQLD